MSFSRTARRRAVLAAGHSGRSRSFVTEGAGSNPINSTRPDSLRLNHIEQVGLTFPDRRGVRHDVNF